MRCVICILAAELYQCLLNSILELFRELYTAARIRILHSTLYTAKQYSYICIYLDMVYIRILYRSAHEQLTRYTHTGFNTGRFYQLHRIALCQRNPFVLLACYKNTPGRRYNFVEVFLPVGKSRHNLIAAYEGICAVLHAAIQNRVIVICVLSLLYMYKTLLIDKQHRRERMQAAHEQSHLLDTIQHSNHVGARAVCIVRSGQVVVHILAVHDTDTCLAAVREYGSGVLLHNIVGGHNRVSCCNGVHKLLLASTCVYEALIELTIGAFEYIFGHVAGQTYACSLR